MAPGDDPWGRLREWSFRQLTAATGTTSRTLRHDQQVELPAIVAAVDAATAQRRPAGSPEVVRT